MIHFRKRVAAATLALLTMAGLQSACTPSAEENAARAEARDPTGVPPDNSFTPGTIIQTSTPEVANTAEASRLQSRADASATPQERGAGSVKGPGAPDTSGRAAQERPRDQ